MRFEGDRRLFPVQHLVIVVAATIVVTSVSADPVASSVHVIIAIRVADAVVVVVATVAVSVSHSTFLSVVDIA